MLREMDDAKEKFYNVNKYFKTTHPSISSHKDLKQPSNDLVGLVPPHLDKNDKKEAFSSYTNSGLVHRKEGCSCLCFTGWSGIACDIPS